jgi:hypothetical protein
MARRPAAAPRTPPVAGTLTRDRQTPAACWESNDKWTLIAAI